MAVAYRVAPHRAGRAGGDVERGSGVARAAAACGLPPAAVTGIRSAVGSGSGREAAPVRSALLGAVIAVVVVVASITFGSSLSFLVSRPALYGWNWDYALLAGFSAAENLPAAETAALLDHDPAVAHWAGVYFEQMKLDGQGVPALASSPNAPVSPPLLSGHGLHAASQVVLGPVTLAQLHKHVGDTVVADTGQRPPVRLRIVGTASLPTIGSSGSPALQMGTGAIVAADLFPAQALNPQGTPVPGPMAVFLTIRPGVTPAAARRSLDQVTAALNRPSDPDSPVGGVVSVLRPAEIANYRAVGSTPSTARRHPRRRRDRRAGAHPDRLGPAPPARVRTAQDLGLHPTAAGRHGGLAVICARDRRGHLRPPPRHRPRAMALDTLRPGALGRS